MRRGIRKTASIARSRPKTGISGADLERGDRSLLAMIERDFSRVADRAREHLRCAPGCCECCHGPFPVTRLDARRLRLGLEESAACDPARAARISQRASDAVESLTPGFPGDATSGTLQLATDSLDAFFARHAGLACPALDPVTGRCDLYEWRPIACRTYGPPARFMNERVEPCPLCFREADAATAERCRLETDHDGLEQSLLDGMGVPAGAEWETLIAFVLAY